MSLNWRDAIGMDDISMPVEHTCSVCGKPEGRKYKPPKETDYVCSTCVQHSLQAGRSRGKSTNGLDPLDFKQGYIRALFLGDERWINCIIKYWMIVPGSPKNSRHTKLDLALKEKLADQIHPDTYWQRKAYYEAWLNAKCCADDCVRYCDECHGIKFEPVPYRLAKEFDADVRRFMEKYQRFWLKSEQDKALRRDYDNQRKISNRKNNDGSVRVRGRTGTKGFGLPGEQAQTAGNPFEGQEEMFLRP